MTRFYAQDQTVPARSSTVVLDQALSRGGVAWIREPRTGHTEPVWFVWDRPTMYVFSGVGEQDHRGLNPDTTQVEVIARSKEQRSCVVRSLANVAVVPPSDPRWGSVAQTALSVRLNAPDRGEKTLTRWREQCTLYTVTPVHTATPNTV